MSSDDLAISVKSLGKRYEMYDSPRDRLKQFISPRVARLSRQQPQQFFKEFWAIRDVSFEIRKGESVGIIGRNGSGKSTLLQLICGTLSPTSGSIQTRGRVAALLELGSGFNPEFTGRENVYMNCAVLGLSRDEVDLRFDSITAFADIGEFIEQPVKTYSSGMAVRLGFAVAVSVDPEILIVDEALSVGDELFQRKCFSRIEAIRHSGATILFVSHSGAQIVELCDRAMLLDAGEKLAIGLPKKIVGSYQRLLYATEETQYAIRSQIAEARDLNVSLDAVDGFESSSSTESSPIQPESFDPNLKPSSTIEYESRGAHIDSAAILTLAGEQVNNLVRGNTYRYTYRVQFFRSAINVRFAMLIKTPSGVELGGAESASSHQDSLAYSEANSSYQVEFRFHCALNPGTYFMNAGVLGDVDGGVAYLHRVMDIATFKVLPEKGILSTGSVDFSCVPGVQILQGPK